MRSRSICRVMISLLLTLVLVCACVVPGLAVTADRLTAQEKTTEQLIEDALAMNRSTVDAMKRGHTYQAFLDTVEARQQTWVRARSPV